MPHRTVDRKAGAQVLRIDESSSEAGGRRTAMGSRSGAVSGPGTASGAVRGAAGTPSEGVSDPTTAGGQGRSGGGAGGATHRDQHMARTGPCATVVGVA